MILEIDAVHQARHSNNRFDGLTMQKIMILAVVAMTLSGFSSTAHAQVRDARIRLEIEQTFDESSNQQYQISSIVFFAEGDVALVSPGGSRFEGFRSDPVSVSTFEEVEAELFGLWTVEDPGRFGTDEVEIHNFTVDPFGLDSVTTELPFIVTPSDNATVQPGFLLDWDYPAGVIVPSGRSVRTSGGTGVDTNVNFGVGTEATINAVFDPGVTSADVTFTAGSFDVLDDLVSPVTTLVDTPRSSFTGSLWFRTRTDPVTVTITSIPEPGTGAFFAACGLVMFCRRKRSRS